MNYQVLARKYRPQRFADVAGQGHATVTLMHAIEQGRIAHGYIFSGHRGIGKTTVARILAMALNCRNAIGSELRPSAEPCAVCESCVEIRAGNAVDVIEIDAATNRGIDEIRELRDAARYRPARDRYKIYILDEAHQITDAAFNALLKTLEEPPDHIVFMMATTQPEDIPQTVRSRCQHFGFRAVKLADIQNELRLIAERESIDASEPALNVLAEAGDGSMRDALSVMDQAIASAPLTDGRPRLDPAQIREMLGTVSNAIFEHMLQAINAARTVDLLATTNDLLDSGNSPPQLARQFVRYLRNVLVARIANLSPSSEEENNAVTSDLLPISTDEQRRAARSAALFTEEELTRFLQVMLRTFDEVGYRQEPRLHLELGLMKLVHLRRLLPIEELLSQLPSASRSQAAPVGTAVASVATRSGPNRPGTPSLQADSLVLPELSSPPLRGGDPNPAPHSQRPLITSETEAEALPAGNSTATMSFAPVPLPLSAANGPPGGVPASADVGVTDQSQQVPSHDVRVADLQSGVLEALQAHRGQSSAADALADATWSLHGQLLRVQTTLSKAMLGVLLTAETHQIIRAALATQKLEQLSFEVLAGAPAVGAVAEAGKRRPARSGSAEVRAQQHPIVQEAQRLFNAEIRNVIDLSGAGK